MADSSGTVQHERIVTAPVSRGAPAGTLFNYGAVHLLTTATLERLHELYPAGQFDVRRFRPNMLIAPPTAEHDFVENHWIDQRFTIGTTHLYIIDPCPRCVVTTLPHHDLPRDAGILRTIAQHNAVASATAAPGVVLPAVAGVYASVLRAGTIRRGDSISLA